MLDQEKFFELEIKFQKNEISKMQFFSAIEALKNKAVNKPDMRKLVLEAYAKYSNK